MSVLLADMLELTVPIEPGWSSAVITLKIVSISRIVPEESVVQTFKFTWEVKLVAGLVIPMSTNLIIVPAVIASMSLILIAVH